MAHRIDFKIDEVLEKAGSVDDKITALFEFMRRHGQSCYEESVTQLEHALQAAHLARGAQVPADQVAAALLHDIGHFLMDEHSNDSDFQEEDWCHETVGAEHLERWFGPAITEPIRLHVPAKRYLCTVDPSYVNGLSAASQRSLELQGGVMSDAEKREFESNEYYETAVRMRRWDDGAKVEGLPVPDLEAYRDDVASCFLQTG